MDLTNPSTQTWHDLILNLNPHSAQLGHRAWWHARQDPSPSPSPSHNPRKGTFEGIEQTLTYLTHYLHHHHHHHHETKDEKKPIDAIWGFSQGACLAGILLALSQRSQSSHPLPQQFHQPSIKAGVIFAGFRARFEQYDDFYEPHGISLPVLHVIGQRDPLVESERSEALMRICAKEEVLRFDGGHEIPKGESDVRRIVEFTRKYVVARGGGDVGREVASM